MYGAMIESAGQVIGGLVKAGQAISNNKKAKKLERDNKRPTYKIADEYSQNQGIARGLAYGRDAAVVNQEKSIEQSVADTLDDVTQTSTNATQVLSALQSVNKSRMQATASLAATEAATQTAGKSALMGANTAMAEEKDKAFEYNENQPYQLKVAEIRKLRKRAMEQGDQAIDLGVASAATFGQGMTASGMMGGGGGGAAGGATGGVQK